MEPLHLAAALAAAATLARVATEPVADIDVYWHVLVGREVLGTGGVSGLGQSWVLAGEPAWTTTQWLSEVALATAHSRGGWTGVLVLRVLAATVTLGALAVAVLHHRPARAAVPVAALASLPLWQVLTQERPQSLALPFCVLAGAWLARALQSGRLPRWWVLALATWVWAQVHGSWVLAPGVLGLVAAARLADGPHRPRAAAAPAGLALLAVAAGWLTPSGAASLVAPLVFAGRTGHLSEWQPADLHSAPALALAALLAVLALAWARSTTPVPRGEVLAAALVALFAASLQRNLAPGLLLLAPLVAARAAQTWPRAYVSTPIERRVLTAGVTAVLATGVLTAGVLLTAVRPLADAAPLAIAARLAERDGPVRVLNDYDTAGVLAFFGGEVRLGIDGRADRYPAAYTRDYLGAQWLRGDWPAVLRRVNPDVAVLRREAPLAAELERRGWSATLADGDYVLLEPAG